MEKRATLRVRLAFSAALVAMLLAPAAVIASDKYKSSETAEFPDVRPGGALLYVVRDEGRRLLSSPFKVFADLVPLGYLKPRSYLTADIEPGSHLLWGPDENEPKWYDFEAGKTYVLRIHETWSTRMTHTGTVTSSTSVIESTTWVDSGTVRPRDVIEGRKLKYASLTDEGRSALGEDAAKGFAKSGGKAVIRPAAAVTQAGDAAALPRTFEKIWYRPEDIGALAAVFKHNRLSGSLTVTRDTLELASDDERVVIPVPAIRSVTSDFMPGDIDTVWVIVQYVGRNGMQLAGFAPSSLTHDRRSNLQAIAEAIGAARSVTRLEPMEQVVRAVESAEALEAGRALQTSSFPGYLAARDDADKRREELHKVDPILTAHLESAPADVEALFLQVRLDRVLGMLTPVVISGGEVQPGDALAPKRDPQATLDTILTLSPGNARAYYWKARLYGVSNPVPGGASGLDRAIEYAGRAVAADPGRIEYREALALYLISADKETAALEVIGKGADLRHPLRLLLLDRSNIPFPAGSIVQREMAMEMAEVLASDNSSLEYPTLRVLARIVPGRASDVEAFYKKRWPEFRFRAHEDADEPEMKSFETEMEWRGDLLAPTGGVPSKRKKPAPDSLAMLVVEMPDVEADVRQRFGLPASGPVCQIIAYNFRTVATSAP
jgi:hypothetical protein